ncbi:hypothetical protein LCGC14_0598740 [marine sediment metagenome]|uniref:Uncharacterized protein n=1 Tax=marine sediment metagenome TaxID=412755 RepID=A0A0F9TXF3_9ZZZZ
MTLQELKTQMAAAVAEFNKTGDMSKIQEVSNAMNKAKVVLAKEEATRLQAEAEKLAGVREALAIKIHGAVVAMGLAKELLAVKAWGFTYKVDNAVPGAEDTRYKSVALTTAIVKRVSTGGGGSGKLKDITGLSRWEIMEKYGTDVEKQKLVEAGADSRPRWFASEPAIKRILNEHPELIKK